MDDGRISARTRLIFIFFGLFFFFPLTYICWRTPYFDRFQPSRSKSLLTDCILSFLFSSLLFFFCHKLVPRHLFFLVCVWRRDRHSFFSLFLFFQCIMHALCILLLFRDEPHLTENLRRERGWLPRPQYCKGEVLGSVGLYCSTTLCHCGYWCSFYLKRSVCYVQHIFYLLSSVATATNWMSTVSLFFAESRDAMYSHYYEVRMLEILQLSRMCCTYKEGKHEFH